MNSQYLEALIFFLIYVIFLAGLTLSELLVDLGIKAYRKFTNRKADGTK